MTKKVRRNPKTFRQAVAPLGPVVALDVETSGALNPHECTLLCVGLSDGVYTVVLWPWSDALAEPLRKFLETRKEVVCHNLSYDKTVLARYGVA